MNKAAILHVPKSQYSFAYGKKELRIRLRAAKSDLDKVEIIYAVKYDWLKDRKTKVMQNSYSDALYDYYTVSLDVPDSRIGYIFLLQSGEEKYYYSEEGLTVDYNHEKSYYNFFQYPSIIFFMTAEGVTGKTLSVSTTNFISKVICSSTQAADNNAVSPRNSLNNVISLKFSSSITARTPPSGIKKGARQLVIKPEIVSHFGNRCISERFDTYSFCSSVGRL